jgi:hypothetical protein
MNNNTEPSSWPFFSHRKDKANIRDIAQQRLTAQVPEVQCQY